MAPPSTSLQVVWMPLAADHRLHRATLENAASLGCGGVQLSHYLCHDADDLLLDAARAAQARAWVTDYRRAGLSVWCWTHEFRLPPAAALDAGVLDFDAPALWRHLEEKYDRFLGEVMPDIDGLVLTFAETDFPVYFSEAIRGGGSPAARITRLANALHAVCRRHGKRLAIRDFVYRRDEVAIMAEALRRCDDGIVIMSKCVPHDWHPFYPANPLLGRVAPKEQWVEFDFGHEYEGQHLYPYAEVEANLARLRHARACGCSTIVVRLDRTTDFEGLSALHTPWGRLELLTVRRFAQDPGVTAEAVWAEWEAGQFPGARRLVEDATRAVQQMLFPQRFWYADHSRLPTFDYAASHLVDGNADRLPAWTGDPAHVADDGNFRRMPPAWVDALERETAAALELAAACAARLRAAPPPRAEPWRAGVRRLELWMRLFALHRRAFFALDAARKQGTLRVAADEVSGAIDALERACAAARDELAADHLENAPATANFAAVVASLRAALGRAPALAPLPSP